MTITVGQVSGIIAAAIFVVQHLLPNAVVIVLVGLLSTEHSAVTWSVVQRQIGSSLWPVVLRSDMAAGEGVQLGVSLLSKLRLLGLILVALAAVVTPLGLYEAVVADNETTMVPFTYFQDTSPMGYGTPAQPSSVSFQRVCGDSGYIPCPGTNNSAIGTTTDDGDTDIQVIGTYDTTMPQATIELYQSGLSTLPKSVSSFFDIRSRQYTYRSTPGMNDGEPYPVDTFRMLESLILDDKIEPVPGLVIDMINGGIGFRNHSLPPQLGNAAQWSEDLLWLEPVSECVDTNLTLEFVIGDGTGLSSFDMKNMSLVDNGGFVNLVQEFPEFSMEDNQQNPKLRDRAYKAAWMTNAYAALTMNVTRPSPNAFAYLNSALGQKFPISSGGGSANSIATDSSFLTMFDPDSNTKGVSNLTVSNSSMSSGGIYDNPFGISSSNYSAISILCSGAGGGDYANSSNLLVECGLFLGPAFRADGVDTLLFEPNTTWRQNVFTCASLNKVSIKTVSFSYNATLGNDLKALNVTSVQNKTYENGEPVPLWGIEQPDPPIDLGAISQLWGLISDDNANAPNLSTKRAAELYIPGWTTSSSLYGAGIPGFEYAPGANAPQNIISAIYGLSPTSSGGVFDYTGASNLALFRRWQTLSGNISTVPQILHLVWTDLAANMIQGSRGQDTVSSTDPIEASQQKYSNMAPVLVYRKRIQYHWLYAIPAFLALLVFALILILACIMAIVRGGPARIRHYSDHLSAGRVAAAALFGAPVNMPRKQWIKQYGKMKVKLDRYDPGAHAGMAHGQAIMLDQKDGKSTQNRMEDETPLNPSAAGHER